MNIYAIAVLGVFVIGSGRAAAAQTGTSTANEQDSAGWRRVQSLSRGAQVQVRRLDKTTVNGRFSSASDGTLIVIAESGEVSLDRGEVRQVRVRRASARFRGGALGAVIGAAAGIGIAVALGGALTDGDGVSSEAAAALGTLGGGIGFAAGVLPRGYTTIYKTRSSR